MTLRTRLQAEAEDDGCDGDVQAVDEPAHSPCRRSDPGRVARLRVFSRGVRAWAFQNAS
jgi:hypothetical protein